MEQSVLHVFELGGFGLVIGFIIGYTLKKLSKFLLVIIGLFLIGIQLLVYNGIININWNFMEMSLHNFINNGNLSLSCIKSVFLVNLPFAGLASIGFLLGLKKG